MARTAGDAVAVATQSGFPVAVKIASPVIVHKTEIGGVVLNLRDQAQVRPAFAAIQERLAREGRLEALEGVHVEILCDVAFRLTPLTNRDAREMVRAICGWRLLEGYRGHSPADVKALEEGLLRVSLLVEEVPEPAELDLNPVFALPPGRGCQIIDARLRVEPARSVRAIPPAAPIAEPAELRSDPRDAALA